MATDNDETASRHVPSRRTPRACFHNYCGGEYFVTICTKGMKNYFGDIADGRIFLSEIGRFADEEILHIPMHHAYADVMTHVVMPNHIHAIIHIRLDEDAVRHVPASQTALGAVVGSYKQAVTCFARRNNIDFAWQPRYHDHIIRGTRDGNNIAEYIANNVARWDEDRFFRRSWDNQK